MPTGRTIVRSAWVQIADDVRSGRLTGDRGLPGRRAFLPLMRGLLPDLSAKDIYADVVVFDDHVAARIVEALLAEQDALREVSELLDRVLDRASEYGFARSDDPPYTRTIGLYFERRTRGAPMSEDQKSALVDYVCRALDGRSSEDGTEKREILRVATVNDLFRDAEERAWMQKMIASVTPARRLEATSNRSGDLVDFLDAVDVTGLAVTVAPDGAAAWRRLVANASASLGAVDDLRLGLSAHDHAPLPELGGSLSDVPRGTPPLDWPLHRRMHSVAKGASGESWASGLPSARELAALEIEGLGHPFQLCTVEARTVMVAGVRAYVGAISDPRALTVDSTRLDEAVAIALVEQRRRILDQQTAASRIITLRIGAFLRGLGDKNPMTGWARLSFTAQDELSQLDRTLAPMLWRRVHNAQYRPGLLTDGTQAWSLIYGQFVNLRKEIGERHKRSPEMSGTQMLEEFHAPSSIDEPPSPDRSSTYDQQRDARVMSVISALRERGVGNALKDLLTGIRALGFEDADGLRETWTTLAGTSAATWDDLLGFLDDHMGS